MNKLAVMQHHSASIRLASLQFLSLAAVGMVSPYINLYLTELGFSATMIGTLASVGAILALTLTPVLNRIADNRMIHRRLFMGYMVGSIIAYVVFANTDNHILLMGAVLLIAVTVGPSMTLGMQLTMTKIADRGKAMLGQIRSFAALGFSAASLLAGQMYGIGGYSLLFWVGAIFAALTIQLATIFPDKPKIKDKRSGEKPAKRRPAFYVLVACQFFMMMGIQNAFAFTFVHLSQNLGVATGNIGIWAAFLAGMEVPFFVMMDRILPKFEVRTAYIFGILGMAVYLFILGAVDSLIGLAVLIVFRGFIWPSLHLTAYMIVAEVSQPGNVATNQAIMQVTIPSIAVLLTGPAFGWVFDHWGSQSFFALCGVMCIVGAGVSLVCYRLLDVNRVSVPA